MRTHTGPHTRSVVGLAVPIAVALALATPVAAVEDPPDADVPVVAVSDVTVTESGLEIGARRGNDLKVKVTLELDEPATETVTVDWVTMGGTAVAGDDFVESSGVVRFRPGQTQRTAKIQLLNDQVVESEEFFDVALVQVDGPATLGDPSSRVTIVDDDAVPEFRVGDDIQILEGTAGPGRRNRTLVSIPVELSAPFERTIDIYPRVDGGDAVSGVPSAYGRADYVRNYGFWTQRLRFRRGMTTATYTFQIFPDDLPESDKTLELRFDHNRWVTPGDDGRVVITIVDDD